MKDVRLTIIRTDKDKTQHLTVKTVEWLLERIQTDTKAGDVARLRQYMASYGDTAGFTGASRIASIYPLVEMAKTENGSLEVTACNGLVWLHVADLMRPDDITAVKEACKILPTTVAAFTGSDGRSAELLVSVAQRDGREPLSSLVRSISARRSRADMRRAPLLMTMTCSIASEVATVT